MAVVFDCLLINGPILLVFGLGDLFCHEENIYSNSTPRSHALLSTASNFIRQQRLSYQQILISFWR